MQRGRQRVALALSRHRLDLLLPGLGVDDEPEAASKLVSGIRDDDAVVDGRVQQCPERRMDDPHAVASERASNLLRNLALRDRPDLTLPELLDEERFDASSLQHSDLRRPEFRQDV